MQLLCSIEPVCSPELEQAMTCDFSSLASLAASPPAPASNSGASAAVPDLLSFLLMESFLVTGLVSVTAAASDLSLSLLLLSASGSLAELWPPATGGCVAGVEEGERFLNGCLSRYTVKTTSCRRTSKSHVITEPLSLICMMPSWTWPLATANLI